MQKESELYHYGRLGMKWGQHIYKDRYGGLNNSGRARVRQLSAEHKRLASINTLSKKGVKRLADVEKEYEHLTGKTISSHVSEKLGIKTPKRVEDLTNEELQAYNTRKQLETTYLGYQPKPTISKGKRFVSFVGNKVVLPIAMDIGKAYVTSLGADKVTGQDMTKSSPKAKEAAKNAAKKSVQALLTQKKKK